MTKRVQRMPVIGKDELPEKAADVLKQTKTPYLNLFGQFANHPNLMEKWLRFAAQILGKNTIKTREKEMIITRATWLAKTEYEHAGHSRNFTAKAAGGTKEELDAIRKGPDDPLWNGKVDKTILTAVDEVTGKDKCLTDATYNALVAAGWTKEQIIDLIFTAGNYTMLAMFINSAGVPAEGKAPKIPDWYDQMMSHSGSKL